jgi:hypothetical protein
MQHLLPTYLDGCLDAQVLSRREDECLITTLQVLTRKASRGGRGQMSCHHALARVAAFDTHVSDQPTAEKVQV